ncbi:metalloregulator ArsR/SmtB family transcription factor [Hoeflea sp. G2-23]|uniref:Metalloregulator ArsR/SmtB family transcription factor n=1 Tax=Hoeflea algicola TaxID=2983763 RepID=A0ABT3ZA23_9HYPH|nr:metalloregulator ArsR/SmtB family transcription factor [Hoeflea algicola]MCY0148101.1 metalloregulator ArsR/SmtB family transcription factor [Hoeflea algicola]
METHCLEHHSKEAAKLLAVMGNQKRMMILCNLTRGEMQVGSLAERVGLSQSALSQHLAKLRNQHLVQTRRESQTIFYSIKSDSVCKMLQTLTSIYCAGSAANDEQTISKIAANA